MVNVIGLGYIGLPTALMLASHGVEVAGTDYNEELVKTLNSGHVTFKEHGLDELLRDAIKAGIQFTTEYQETDIYVVSVPTPYDKFSKKIDAKYVLSAVQNVMKKALFGATFRERWISLYGRRLKKWGVESERIYTLFMPRSGLYQEIWFMSCFTITVPLERMTGIQEKR